MADASPAPTPEDEPYQSLYRRYRPQRFGAVRGQEHVTRALRNAVRDEKVAHAYLFSGPRGTGKTSTARILAMALNCANPVDGEPDGTCASCVDIRRGASLDVQELDAASNRKIDEMRGLLSRVALGISGRWKVYIVDEVHQLTNDAASMLLKTLEEPPGHVIFVLATTDPQKVLPTIRSRTQHFEFRLLGPDVLGDLLRDVNERAALGIAPEAIDLVVRRGHGSARDALSVLDQVAAIGEVDDESTVARELVDAVADQDAGRVLTAVAEAMSAGRDPGRVATDLLDHLRNGFLAVQARGLVHLADDAAAEVEAQARRLGLAGIVRALEVVGAAAAEMRDAVDPRVTFEVALVRLAAPRADDTNGALLRRLEQLEAQVAALAGTAAGAGVRAVPPVVEGGADQQQARPPVAVAPLASLVEPSQSGSPVGAPETQPAKAPDTRRRDPAPADIPSASGPRRAVAPGPPAGSRPRVGTPPPQPGRRRPASDGPPAPPPAPAPVVRLPPTEAPSTPQPAEPAPPAGPTPAGPTPAGPTPAGPPPATSPPATSLRGASPSATPAQGAPPSATPPPAEPPSATPPHLASSSATSPLSVTAPGSAPPMSSTPAVTAPGTSPDGDGPPSRDALTKAWGDVILPGLRPAVKAYVSSGRFVEVDGSSAVYALPDQGLLTRARTMQSEVESALAAHFGRPVPLRLVRDGDGGPAGAPVGGAPPVEDDPGDYDLDDLEDAGPALVSPEQRLLEAFPGAEEVTP